MDTDTGKSDLLLLISILMSGVKLIVQLRTLRKQVQKGEITKENLETSYVVTTLLKLDRYVSELLDRYKKKY